MTPGYEDKSIFLPAAGLLQGGVRNNAGDRGYYWSSTVKSGPTSNAFYLLFNVDKTLENYDSRVYSFSVRAVRDAAPPVASDIKAKSEAGTVDLRDDVPLDEGAVTVAGVAYSDTAWGTEPETNVTLGYTNETTGATGTLATDLSGSSAADVNLPKKDGAYRLTHRREGAPETGLTSFVTFTVSGYPFGCETNPWEIGAGDDPASVTVVTNGVGDAFFTPVRGVVSGSGLKAFAMATPGYTAWLVSADGSVTNELQMVLGESGKAYDTIEDALVADEASYTLFEVKGYWVSYDRGGNDGQGEPQPDDADPDMATDMFVPSVSTNLTANAYVRTNFVFDCWLGWTNGVRVTHLDGAEGVDFCEPGATLALTAQWTRVAVPLTVTNLAHTTVTVWTNGVELTTDNVATNAFGDGTSVYLAQTNANVTVVYRAVAGYVLQSPGKSGTVVHENLTYGYNDCVPADELPTVVAIADKLDAGTDYIVDGGMVVIKAFPQTADGVVTLPESINGNPVAEIADKAFDGASWLKELDCSAATSLTSIGSAAFRYCTGLRKVTLPPYLTTVGANAFDLCASLTDLVLPEDLATVGSNAFVRCYSLANVVFNGNPPTVSGGTTPNYSMFYGANDITLTVPADWTEADVTPFFSGKKTWQKLVSHDGCVWRYEMDPGIVTPTIAKLFVTPGEGGVTVTNPIAGLVYRLEASADLTPGSWAQEGDDHTCTPDEQNNKHSLTLPCEAGGGTKFFRVTVSEK